jgi:hypothetical protein
MSKLDMLQLEASGLKTLIIIIILTSPSCKLHQGWSLPRALPSIRALYCLLPDCVSPWVMVSAITQNEDVDMTLLVAFQTGKQLPTLGQTCSFLRKCTRRTWAPAWTSH